jgi:hypothetical protein
MEKIPKTFQKIAFFSSFLLKFKIYFSAKQCYPHSFPILGRRDSTRALQSGPFQNPGGVTKALRRRRRTNGNP